MKVQASKYNENFLLDIITINVQETREYLCYFMNLLYERYLQGKVKLFLFLIVHNAMKSCRGDEI
jgi:hypothetical protein